MTPWERYKEQHLFAADSGYSGKTGIPRNKTPLRGGERQAVIRDTPLPQAVVKDAGAPIASRIGASNPLADAGRKSAASGIPPIRGRNRLPRRGSESRAILYDGTAGDRRAGPKYREQEGRKHSLDIAATPWTDYKRRNQISGDVWKSVPEETETVYSSRFDHRKIGTLEPLVRLWKQRERDPDEEAVFLEQRQKGDYLNASAIKPPAEVAGSIPASEKELYGLAYDALSAQSSFQSANRLANEMAQFQHGEAMTEEEIKNYGTRVGLLLQDARYSLSWLEENKNRIRPEEYTDLKQLYEIQSIQAQQMSALVDWYRNGGSAKVYTELPQMAEKFTSGIAPMEELTASIQGLEQQISELEAEREKYTGYLAGTSLDSETRAKWEKAISGLDSAIQERADALALEEERYSVYWQWMFHGKSIDESMEGKTADGKEVYEAELAALEEQYSRDYRVTGTRERTVQLATEDEVRSWLDHEWKSIAHTDGEPTVSYNEEKGMYEIAFSETDDRFLNESLAMADAREDHPVAVSLDHMDEAEKNTFYYLIGAGYEDMAISYANAMALETRREKLEKIEKASGNWHGVFWAPAVYGLLFPVAGYDALAGSDYLNTGLNINPSLGPAAIRDALLSGAAGTLNEFSGTLPQWMNGLLPGTGGKGAGDLYQAGVSTLESYAATMAFREYALLPIALSANSSAYNDAVMRGATPEEARKLGVVSGIAEALFELLPMGEFLDGKVTGSLVKDILIQGGLEGAEEALTTISNEIADRLIMQDKSHYEQRIQTLMTQDGLSRNEAEAKARTELFYSISFDALVGLVSGVSTDAVFHGGAYETADTILSYRNSPAIEQQNLYQLAADLAGVKPGDSDAVIRSKLTQCFGDGGAEASAARQSSSEKSGTEAQGKTDPAQKSQHQTNEQIQTDPKMQGDPRTSSAGQAGISLPQTGRTDTATQKQGGAQSQAPAGSVPAKGQAISAGKEVKSGSQYYMETGRFSEKTAREAGAVLDKIRNGEVSWKDLSNADIAKLKLTTSQGAKAASLALGIPIPKALTPADARSTIRSAVMQIERTNVLRPNAASRNMLPANASSVLEKNKNRGIIRSVDIFHRNTAEDKEHLLKELENSHTKFSKENIEFVTRDQTGQIVWLERGNAVVGLEHILKRHASDFMEKHNIIESDISKHLESVITSGSVEYSRIQERNGRACCERLYSYNGDVYLLAGIGLNGFVVSGYPIDVDEALKKKGKYANEENKNYAGLFSGTDLAE